MNNSDKKLYKIHHSAEVDVRQRKNTFLLFVVLAVVGVVCYHSNHPVAQIFKGLVDLFVKLFNGVFGLVGLNVQTVVGVLALVFCVSHFSGVKRSESRRDYFNPFGGDKDPH